MAGQKRRLDDTASSEAMPSKKAKVTNLPAASSKRKLENASDYPGSAAKKQKITSTTSNDRHIELRSGDKMIGDSTDSSSGAIKPHVCKKVKGKQCPTCKSQKKKLAKKARTMTPSSEGVNAARAAARHQRTEWTDENCNMQKQSRLGNLPAELLNDILEMALVQDTPVALNNLVEKSSTRNRRPGKDGEEYVLGVPTHTEPGILQSCRYFRQLGHKFYYYHNTFACNDTETADAFLKRLTFPTYKLSNLGPGSLKIIDPAFEQIQKLNNPNVPRAQRRMHRHRLLEDPRSWRKTRRVMSTIHQTYKKKQMREDAVQMQMAVDHQIITGWMTCPLNGNQVPIHGWKTNWEWITPDMVSAHQYRVKRDGSGTHIVHLPLKTGENKKEK